MRFIGSKKLLLNSIEELVNEKAPNSKTFCDIFSGSAIVARHFKKSYEIISNDLLYFSYVLQKGTIEMDSNPKFKKLSNIGIIDPILYFNNLKTEEMNILSKEKRFFQNNYSPNGGRMYITDENALRIDFSRSTIEGWKNKDLINENEYFYLIASVVEGIPYVSNISGTYGAYHKTWDKRAYKEFKLTPLDIITNNKKNKCYNDDGIKLLKKIKGDILYIDPPYNGRQYSSNYHVLETAARYDFPEIKGVTGQRIKDDGKSKFCMKREVINQFDALFSNANFKHIILSYSTDGLVSVEELEKIMKKYGKADTFDIKKIPYKRYRSKMGSKSKKQLFELLLYIEKEV